MLDVTSHILLKVKCWFNNATYAFTVLVVKMLFITESYECNINQRTKLSTTGSRKLWNNSYFCITLFIDVLSFLGQRFESSKRYYKLMWSPSIYRCNIFYVFKKSIKNNKIMTFIYVSEDNLHLRTKQVKLYSIFLYQTAKS